jgi:hypothetical protein
MSSRNPMAIVSCGQGEIEVATTVAVRGLNLVPARAKPASKQKPKLWGMGLACKVHSQRTASEKRTAADSLEEAEAFLADKTSKWARLLPMSERGRR